MPRRLLGPDEHRLIARLHVEGLSDAEIAGRVGEQVGERVERSTIRKARHRPGAVEMIAAARKSAQSTERSRRQRSRERDAREAAARDPARLAERLVGHPASTPERIFVKVLRRDLDTGAMIDTGTREMIRKHGRWYRATATCGLAPAKRSDFEGDVPASFDAEVVLDYGPPGHPREALGTIHPSTRVRLPVGHPLNRGSVEHVSPILDGPDLDAALAAGAELLTT